MSKEALFQLSWPGYEFGNLRITTWTGKSLSNDPEYGEARALEGFPAWIQTPILLCVSLHPATVDGSNFPEM